MGLESHEMSDEELEIFSNKSDKITEILLGTPPHLIAPMLIRLTVGTHLEMKQLPHTEESLDFARRLVEEISNILVNRTNRYLNERN